MNNQSESYLLMATATSWSGVRGEMKVTLYNPESEYFTKNAKFFTKYQGKGIGQIEAEETSFDSTVHLQMLNQQGKFPKIKFSEIDQKEENANFFPMDLYAIKSEIISTLEEGEYLLSDLVGFQVFSENEELVGSVEGFYSNGMQDILSIKKDKNFKTFEVFDLPMGSQFIKKVDTENQRIII